jgi:hypothetical protein
MAGEQRKLAHASKRDSGAQKTIALLGAVFLPGAYLASVFSMTFFNFQNANGGGSSNGLSGSSADNSTSTSSQDNSNPPVVSSQFWIYWVVTIPMTIVIVMIWYVWEKRREKRYQVEDNELEKGVETMELQIQSAMRKRTMSKVTTWDTKHGGD